MVTVVIGKRRSSTALSKWHFFCESVDIFFEKSEVKAMKGTLPGLIRCDQGSSLQDEFEETRKTNITFYLEMHHRSTQRSSFCLSAVIL